MPPQCSASSARAGARFASATRLAICMFLSCSGFAFCPLTVISEVLPFATPPRPDTFASRARSALRCAGVIASSGVWMRCFLRRSGQTNGTPASSHNDLRNSARVLSLRLACFAPVNVRNRATAVASNTRSSPITPAISVTLRSASRNASRSTTARIPLVSRTARSTSTAFAKIPEFSSAGRKTPDPRAVSTAGSLTDTWRLDAPSKRRSSPTSSGSTSCASIGRPSKIRSGTVTSATAGFARVNGTSSRNGSSISRAVGMSLCVRSV